MQSMYGRPLRRRPFFFVVTWFQAILSIESAVADKSKDLHLPYLLRAERVVGNDATAPNVSTGFRM
jgi:hypothetical protein